MTRTLQRPIIGHTAPEAELTHTDGTPWSLRGHRGQSVVLIFHRHIH